MFVAFRRKRKCQRIHLMTTCLVLSVVMMCWQQESGIINHVKAYSYRYLDSGFLAINRSLTITREQAHVFSNFRYLLDNPDKCQDRDILLLVLIKTSPENFKRRRAIRATWGNETYIQKSLGATVKVLFVLGAIRTKDNEPLWTKRSGAIFQEQLVEENSQHRDLIQQDFLDSFHNLTLKLILQFQWMHQRCAHARFFMTADDDIFVHMPNLVRYLQAASSRGVTNYWVGKVHRGAPPIREKQSKYYVPFEMYQWPIYPDYTAGAAYVVSKDVAHGVYHAMLTLNASIYIDDVFMGICGNAIGVSPQDHVYFAGEGRTPYHPCLYSQMMTSHGHVDNIYELWEATQTGETGSGLVASLYCTAVKVSLLCQPWYQETYPCSAAFV